MLVGFEYDKENYFYSRDLTGNITSIVDKNGLIIVEYQYDAWGRWLNQTTAAKTSIGTTLLSLNPFLYKGYIYDGESGFYYLKSRYYSPEVRRFINVDSEVGDVGKLENHNLFAYCENNPINLADENGNLPKWLKFLIVVAVAAIVVVAIASLTVATGGSLGVVLIGVAVGAGISGAVSAGTQLAQTGTIDICNLLTDMSIGAVAGALGASSFGSLVMPFFSGALGFSGSVASDWVAGEDINWGKAAFAGALGFILGMGGGAQNGQKATDNLLKQTKLKDFVKSGKKLGTKQHQRLVKAADKALSEVFKSGRKTVLKGIPGDFVSDIIQKVDLILFG